MAVQTSELNLNQQRVNRLMILEGLALQLVLMDSGLVSCPNCVCAHLLIRPHLTENKSESDINC